MDRRYLHRMTVLGLMIAGLATLAVAQDQEGVERSNDRPGVNLAVVAVPSASYVSGDTSLSALNDGYEPGRSRDRRRGSYGNWNRTGTQWVQFDWSQPISTNKIAVFWWMDGRGIHAPSASRLLYWNGGDFVPVENASSLGLEADRFNETTFDEVTTSKLRLEVDSDGTNSTGILEWRVFDSGNSPKFPPRVTAAPDRVVILGGKTYLDGEIQTLGGDASGTNVRWTKQSGPGEIQFEDATALATTATFDQLGDYVLALTAADGDLEGSDTVKVQVAAAPPDKGLGPVATRPYQVSSQLWKNRLKATIVNWIPHCIAQINDPDLREGGINNIESAANKLAGREYQPHRGYVFSNAWVLNTVEAMCVALMVDPQGDEEIAAAQDLMRATLADWIPKIIAAQEPDGYFQTAFTLPRRGRGNESVGGDFEHWTRRSDHEGYVAAYFLDAAVAHHRLTGGTDSRFYEAARRLADCWDENIGPPPKREWYNGHQAMEMALVDFGRYIDEVEGPGQGDRYVQLAKFLLDSRRGGSEYDQSHVPVIQQYEAVGHAVRASYSYTGMADVALATGDVDYHSAVRSLWDNITNKKYYVTGGIGSGESSEGFGPDYSLRQNAYCESCSGCGELFFQNRLNLTYHDARFADLAEETLYNAILGDLDLDGNNFYYQNPLAAFQTRYPWHGCPCCVGNIPRTLLNLPAWTYAKTDDELFVNMFIGSTVDVGNVADTSLQLIQETDYPWNGTVKITVNPAEAREFTIHVRSPERSVSDLYTSTPDADGITSISVNGQSLDAIPENGYVVIHRTWQPGDVIELELPLVVQRVKCIDEVEANRGRVALKYGPLVYNIESVDQDVDSVLPADAELTTEWRPDLLGGVLAITGQFEDGEPMLAIPNYARQNRAPTAADRRPDAGPRRRRGGRGSQSIVWIRDQ